MENEHVSGPADGLTGGGLAESSTGATGSAGSGDGPTDRYGLRERVSAELAAFVDRQALVLGEIGGDGADFEPVIAGLRTFLDGGKRMRAAFCYWGWRAAGGAEDSGVGRGGAGAGGDG